MSWITSLFSGGLVTSVENVASEWIQTDLESAEAQALMIKTLDPNGKMRRDLSIFACKAYGFYLIAMVILAFMMAFDLGDAVGAKAATDMMKELFFPITTAWGAIVGASFGVNGVNSYKNKS